MDEVDVELRHSFLQSKLPGNMPEIVLEREKTAVLVIDVQYMNAHREGKYGRWAREQGIQDQVDWYFSRLEQLTGDAKQESRFAYSLESGRSTKM